MGPWRNTDITRMELGGYIIGNTPDANGPAYVPGFVSTDGRVSGMPSRRLHGGGGGVTNSTNLWIHFRHCHTRDTVVILKEGNHTHP